MTERVLCSQCGNALSSGSPGGLCPACLLRLALDGTQGEESTLAAPEGSSGPEDLGSVGPYRLLSILGEGGMGTVYLAEQSEPIRRRVALKVIKRGMDTKDVIARFESERQALALMSHQNIARVLDAGTTKDGLPYFVMEHVAGVPITEYCDQNRLDSRSRLKLFEQVCLAVQHAHQKGIIHRDIKPSNVLVSEEEGAPRPRIIDFGVAKAVNQRLTEKTLFTQRGVIVGTPGYMSPEQADPTALDVDIRTDIYSLGVLLYEIVAGVPPFDPKRLLSAGWGEMQRIIREEEPQKPSTRVSKLGDTATGIAGRRRTTPGALEKDLSGDLDWITLKALEKDRARRYQSATEFSADIQRYLSDEPVIASPPGTAYRVSKFIRRHKAAVTAAAAIVAALAIGLVVALVQYRRAELERSAKNQQLVRSNVATGMRIAEDGDYFGALPWLVRALKLEEGGAMAREAHRYRIGTLLDSAPQLRHLWHHPGGVNAGALSPDGRFAVTAGQDRTVRVWSLATGEPVTPSLVHPAPVVSVEFGPDSLHVVTACEDGGARVWNVHDGSLAFSVLRHEDQVRSAAFSHDGRSIVTASPGRNRRNLGLRDGAPARHLESPQGRGGLLRGIFPGRPAGGDGRFDAGFGRGRSCRGSSLGCRHRRASRHAAPRLFRRAPLLQSGWQPADHIGRRSNRADLGHAFGPRGNATPSTHEPGSAGRVLRRRISSGDRGSGSEPASLGCGDRTRAGRAHIGRIGDDSIRDSAGRAGPCRDFR